MVTADRNIWDVHFVFNSKEELQRRRLESALLNLTTEQRRQHERFCQLLEDDGVATPKAAIEAARIIATEGGIRRSRELQYLAERASRHALDESQRTQVEADRQSRDLEQKSEQQRLVQEQQAAAAALSQQAAEENARAEAERATQRAAAQQAARAEPIPGAVERFNATLAQAKADRQAPVHAASMDHLAETRGQRPNYTRFETLKREQATASTHETAPAQMSDEKATRLAALTAPSDEKVQRANSNQGSRKGRSD